MQIIQTLAILNIVLAYNIEKNICRQYLENIDILTSFNGQSSLIEKENNYYIGSNQEQTFTKQYCTDIKLWKYQQFNDPIQLQPIDDNQLIFKISDIRIENQYYAFTYESQNIKFKVQNRKIEYIEKENYRRQLQENIQSKLNFCQNEACTIILNDPEICLNDKFYIKQTVTDSNYSDYYLTNTSVKRVGKGLNQTAKFIEIDNTIKGQVVLLLQASIAWSILEIQIFSNFSNTINGSSLPYSTLSTITTTFKPLDGIQCPQDAKQVSSQLKLCSNCLCTTDLDLNNIHYNDKIYVEQSITNETYKYLHFNSTQISFTGIGLNKVANLIGVDYSENGKVKALLKVDIVWENMTIKIVSYIDDEQRTYDPIIGISPTIECIKVNNTCPSCEDQCSINGGFSMDTCGLCKLNYIPVLKNLIIILLIILL